VNESDLAGIETEVGAEIEEAVGFAEASPREPVEDLLKDVQGQAAL
jgi:TPP-dependent pyruvate/acetoin dehydrogenase alpha subunit